MLIFASSYQIRFLIGLDSIVFWIEQSTAVIWIHRNSAYGIRLSDNTANLFSSKTSLFQETFNTLKILNKDERKTLEKLDNIQSFPDNICCLEERMDVFTKYFA